MGYESRIFVIERKEGTYPNGNKYVYAEKIAMVNMCNMGYNFTGFFDKPIDYKIFVDGETETDEDRYGEHLKYAPVDRVIEWLERELAKYTYKYRRLSPLLGLLKGFDQYEWEELQVVHYGY